MDPIVALIVRVLKSEAIVTGYGLYKFSSGQE